MVDRIKLDGKWNVSHPFHLYRYLIGSIRLFPFLFLVKIEKNYIEIVIRTSSPYSFLELFDNRLVEESPTVA